MVAGRAAVVVIDTWGIVVVALWSDDAGLLEHLVVLLAEEAVIPQSELVPGDQLAFTGCASEAVDVVDLGLGAHHEVVLAKTLRALVALGPE